MSHSVNMFLYNIIEYNILNILQYFQEFRVGYLRKRLSQITPISNKRLSQKTPFIGFVT